MPTFRGVHHVGLVTGDMDETIRFWRDLLGLRLVAGHGDKRYRQYFFELAPQRYVSFFEWPGAEPIEERDPGYAVPGHIAFDHVCLEVVDEEALWGLKDRLEAADCWVTEVVDNGMIISFFTTDPNHITLELCCRVAGVDLGAKPKMLDRDASPLTLEGPEPQHERWPHVTSPTPRTERRVYPGGQAKLGKP